MERVHALLAQRNQTRSIHRPALSERIGAALAPYRVLESGYADPALGITFRLERHLGAPQLMCVVTGSGAAEERLVDAQRALAKAGIRARKIAHGAALIILERRSEEAAAQNVAVAS